MEMLVLLGIDDLHHLILDYLDPVETPAACLVVRPNRFKTRKAWTRSRQTTKTEIVSNGNVSIKRITVGGKLHALDEPALVRRSLDCNHKMDGPCVSAWYQNDQIHRVGGPALVFCGGSQTWYHKGNLHRAKGPAFIHALPNEIVKEYWFKGQLHNEKGPAVVSSDPRRYEWFREGKRHRIDGPALVERDGTQSWYRHGHLHRDGQPAIIKPHNQDTRWYFNGLEHRVDGPCFVDSAKTEYWKIHGTLHRVGGPAIVNVKNGVVTHEQWFDHGVYHRTDGPAYYQLHQQSGEFVEKWFYHGVPHSAVGPACRYANGNKEWIFHGKTQVIRKRKRNVNSGGFGLS